MGTPWGWKGREKGSKKRKNPETIITGQIRELLKLMHIPHEKHWGGPMSAKGIPDLISTLPGASESKAEDGTVVKHPRGRALWCEVKVPGKKPTPEQYEFLDKMEAAGALSFWCDSPKEFIAHLADAKFEPAVLIRNQFPDQIPTDRLPKTRDGGGGNSGRFRPGQSPTDPTNPEAHGDLND